MNFVMLFIMKKILYLKYISKNDSETLGINNYSHNIEVIGNIYDNGELYREIKENDK